MSPNFVEPLENDSVKCETDDEMINCLAVMSPPTIKLSVIDTDPVIVAPLDATISPFFTIN